MVAPLASSREDVENFMHWQDEEGGLLGLARSHSVSVFPVEIQMQATEMLAAFERCRSAFDALLAEHGMVY